MITPEEFVTIWQSSATFAEAVERLGMTKHLASCRAGFYRRRGVALQKFVPQGGPAHLDVEALNKIAREAAKKRGNKLATRGHGAQGDPATVTS